MNEDKFQEIQEDAVEVPYTELSSAVLRSLAEDYVTRDGTDYGEVERSLEAKVSALMRELEAGRAHIFFEAQSETVQIVASHQLKQR